MLINRVSVPIGNLIKPDVDKTVAIPVKPPTGICIGARKTVMASAITNAPNTQIIIEPINLFLLAHMLIIYFPPRLFLNTKSFFALCQQLLSML